MTERTKNILAALAFFGIWMAFCVWILPEALDRELHRQDVVKEYNAKYYQSKGKHNG